MMITTMVSYPQESLSSLIMCSTSSSYESTIRLSMEKQDIPIFGWSDFPCQNDIDIQETLLFGDELHDSSPTWSYSLATTIGKRNEPINKSESCTDFPTSSISKTLRSVSIDATSHCNKRYNKTKKVSKSVRFAPTFEIRIYSVIVGDHPCCVGGLALQCGWDYITTTPIDMELYERQKSGLEIQRRPHEFRLGYDERLERLQATTGMNLNQLVHEEYQISCRAEKNRDRSMIHVGNKALHTIIPKKMNELCTI